MVQFLFVVAFSLLYIGYIAWRRHTAYIKGWLEDIESEIETLRTHIFKEEDAEGEEEL